MKKLLIGLMLIINVASFGQTSEDYKDAVLQMLEVSGGKAAFDAMVSSYLDMIANQGELEPEVLEEMKKLMDDVLEEELAELYAPIYAKHFSLDEIQEMISFYQSPIGQKMAEKNPEIIQEASVVGQEWGRTFGIKLQKILEEKGYF